MDNLPTAIKDIVMNSKAAMEKMAILIYLAEDDDVFSDFLIERSMTDPACMFTVRTRIVKAERDIETRKVIHYYGEFKPPVTVRSKKCLMSLLQAYFMNFVTNFEEEDMDDDWITNDVHMCLYQSESNITDAIRIEKNSTMEEKRKNLSVVHCMSSVEAQMFTMGMKKLWTILDPLLEFIGNNSVSVYP